MKYWHVPDDGAPLKCVECDKYGSHNEMVFCELPNGERLMLHKTCVDEDWLSCAQYMGVFPLH